MRRLRVLHGLTIATIKFETIALNLWAMSGNDATLPTLSNLIWLDWHGDNFDCHYRICLTAFGWEWWTLNTLVILGDLGSNSADFPGMNSNYSIWIDTRFHTRFPL